MDWNHVEWLGMVMNATMKICGHDWQESAEALTFAELFDVFLCCNLTCADCFVKNIIGLLNFPFLWYMESCVATKFLHHGIRSCTGALLIWCSVHNTIGYLLLDQHVVRVLNERSTIPCMGTVLCWAPLLPTHMIWYIWYVFE